MKEKKLFDAITDVRDEFVEEARVTRPQKRKWTWRHWTAAAVCVALIAGLAFAIPGGGQPQGKRTSQRSSGKQARGAASIRAKRFWLWLIRRHTPFDDYDGRHAVMDENPVDDAFLAAIDDFSYETAAEILSDTGENMNYSPAVAVLCTGDCRLRRRWRYGR